ncbi:MAG: coenzyme F420-0:L-glutamate ligase [Nocardioidaceae bacterium]|nr:coenzyme F420-0:L-glutamate ligase [Nocardioidaceae bacterium]
MTTPQQQFRPQAAGSPGGSPRQLVCLPVTGIPEVAEGDDLAGILARAATLEDGDILVVTSKVVSKAEGRVVTAKREEAVLDETDRTVAWRGQTSIVRTHHGLVMAAAGVDASNTVTDTVALLPVDPDASARRLREALARGVGRNVAVLVTDTAGRAWRNGQTDIAIGAAGLDVLQDYAGKVDPHVNELSVTSPAVADELAAAADLVKRKLDRRPAAIVRGLNGLVLRPGDHGPGAAALVRDERQDMFGLGAREAVLSALHEDDPRGFGAPCSAIELLVQLTALGAGYADVRLDGGAVNAHLLGGKRIQGAVEQRMRTAAFALGWRADDAGAEAEEPGSLRFVPATP